MLYIHKDNKEFMKILCHRWGVERCNTGQTSYCVTNLAPISHRFPWSTSLTLNWIASPITWSYIFDILQLLEHGTFCTAQHEILVSELNGIQNQSEGLLLCQVAGYPVYIWGNTWVETWQEGTSAAYSSTDHTDDYPVIHKRVEQRSTRVPITSIFCPLLDDQRKLYSRVSVSCSQLPCTNFDRPCYRLWIDVFSEDHRCKPHFSHFFLPQPTTVASCSVKFMSEEGTQTGKAYSLNRMSERVLRSAMSALLIDWDLKMPL